MTRTLIAAAYAALVVLLLSVPASADVGRCHGYAPGYVAPSYVAPTYHAPAVGYTNYTPHYETLRPYAIPVAIIPSEFYRVDPSVAYARIAEEAASQAVHRATADSNDKLMALLAAVIQQQKGPTPVGAPGGAPGIPPSAPQPIPPLADGSPVTPASPEARATSPSAVVQRMADARCITCHGSGAKLDLTSVKRVPPELRSEMILRLMADPADPVGKKKFMPRLPSGGPGEPVTNVELSAVWAYRYEPVER